MARNVVAANIPKNIANGSLIGASVEVYAA
jgi:hypothetical protein